MVFLFFPTVQAVRWSSVDGALDGYGRSANDIRIISADNPRFVDRQVHNVVRVGSPFWTSAKTPSGSQSPASTAGAGSSWADVEACW